MVSPPLRSFLQPLTPQRLMQTGGKQGTIIERINAEEVKYRTTLHAIKKLLYCWMRAASRKDGPCGFDAAKRIIIKSNLSFEYRYPKTELCHRLAASCVIPNLKVIGLLSESKRSNVQHACSSTLPAVASGLGSRRDRIGSFSIFRNTSWDRGRLLRSP